MDDTALFSREATNKSMSFSYAQRNYIGNPSSRTPGLQIFDTERWTGAAENATFDLRVLSVTGFETGGKSSLAGARAPCLTSCSIPRA